jgi:potassium efflux system protein
VREASDIFFSWLGLLFRGAIFWQILTCISLFLAYRAWSLRHPTASNRWTSILAKLLVAGLLSLSSMGLQTLGSPGGLLEMGVQLILIWTALEALRLVLRRRMVAKDVDRYWQTAIGPLYVVTTFATVTDRLDDVNGVGDAPVLEIFDAFISLNDLLLLLTMPYFLVVLSDLPVSLIGSLLGRWSHLAPNNRKAIEVIMRYVIIGSGLVWLADQIGLNGTAVAAIAGGLSVGLGFGIKEVFSNLISSIWLLFEGSVKPGDVLLHEGDICRVTKLGLRATTLKRQSDNAELVVPSQTFFTTTTTTYTGTDDLRCGFVIVGIDHSHAPEEIIPLLEEIAAAEHGILTHPSPWAGVVNFGEKTIEYSIDFWISDPTKNGLIASSLRSAILQRFRKDGIKMQKPPESSGGD